MSEAKYENYVKNPITHNIVYYFLKLHVKNIKFCINTVTYYNLT